MKKVVNRKWIKILRIGILTCWHVLSLNGFSQNTPKYELLKTLEQKADFITMDKLSNIYARNNNILYKYSSDGELLHTYSTFSKGKISGIDISNPFKIVVFYGDFMQIAILDQKLASLQTISGLSDLNLHLPTCVCASYDNGLWIYDEIADQLFRYDANRNLSNKSMILRQIWDKKVSPTYMKETASGLLVVSSKENGLLIFDRFGTYLMTILIFADRLFFSEDTVFYVEGNELKSMNIKTLQQNSPPLPEPDILQVCLENKKMTILTKDNNVRIYKVVSDHNEK